MIATGAAVVAVRMRRCSEHVADGSADYGCSKCRRHGAAPAVHVAYVRAYLHHADGRVADTSGGTTTSAPRRCGRPPPSWRAPSAKSATRFDDGLSRQLVSPSDLAAYGAAVSELLLDRGFLGSRHLLQYLELLSNLIDG